MSQHQLPDDFLPARQPGYAPATPARESDEYAGIDLPPAGQKVTLKLVGRAVRRHWWQAALAWVVVSVALMALAYAKVKPSALAFARVRVEPGERNIFNATSNEGFETYKETQVSIITQPTVIEAALLKHADLTGLPRFAGVSDTVSEIRQMLVVGIVPKTNLIEISTTSETFGEAKKIVDAVVEAYLKSASDNYDRENNERIKRLRALAGEKTTEVDVMRRAINAQAEKLGSTDVQEYKEKNSVSIEDYKQLSGQLFDVELQIAELETELAQLQNEQVVTPTGEVRDIKKDVERLFLDHPKVKEASERYSRASERYKKLSSEIRDKADPAIQKYLKEMRDAKKQLNDLWVDLEPTLQAEVRSPRSATGAGAADLELKRAEIRLAALKARQASLTDKQSSMKIKQRQDGVGALRLEFEREDLARAARHLDAIQTALQDLEFATKNPTARIHEEFFARQGKGTSNRLKIMAVAPIGVLAGVLGLLVLLELSGGRVVDPEDLPTRVRVPVIGVVPPLPQIRPQSALFSAKDEFRTQRQLDQFVQSLDHLRVALTSSKDAWGRDRRVILITSACGSEGKTTLAAQLAERCVNAGLHTLLVDGDLRNPTLSRMLDAPNDRGLINVLRGEVGPDEAINVVGGAGGFHFMPAGTPRVDPSRLLQGERLGRFLARAREGFDIVIVDAPPVLPVPDALTIGRWTDGAVLAVRYDMSRFPLVEKANRRLATVGVPVIGAVVNGVRVTESTYGSYYPSYDYTNDRNQGTPLDV